MSIREIALDTETTGLSPDQGHRIIEIACVELVGHIRTGKTFHSYLNPGRDVPESAYAIHGISTEFLADKPHFEQIVKDFLVFIGEAPLIIHNAEFDMKFLNAELESAGRTALPVERAFCTMLHARKKFPGAQSSLDALCRRFNIDLSARTLHGALLDAELLADMYLELIGGAQTGLVFAAEQEQQAVVRARRKKRAPRSFPLSQQELEAHRAFLEKIKKPLWLKTEA